MDVASLDLSLASELIKGYLSKAQNQALSHVILAPDCPAKAPLSLFVDAAGTPGIDDLPAGACSTHRTAGKRSAGTPGVASMAGIPGTAGMPGIPLRSCTNQVDPDQPATGPTSNLGPNPSAANVNSIAS